MPHYLVIVFNYTFINIINLIDEQYIRYILLCKQLKSYESFKEVHMSATTFAPEVGIDPENRAKIANGLSRVLADSYLLYVQAHNFHWNVEGPMFHTLHQLFEMQYTELAPAIDEIAERIRALDHYAPGTFSQFSQLSEIEDVAGVPQATDMTRILMRSHETVARTAREVIPIAQGSGDEPTADLLISRMQVHEKAAWMLRSLLK
jgi:starvation-inducible DNA-binding protein